MTTDMRLIFVGGIHGAGKTTLCRKLAPVLGAQHFSAGDLIRMSAGTLPNVEKRVADVRDNQRLLVDAVVKLRATVPTMLLDGHYSVINASDDVEAIPLEVFRSISPSMLLLISADPVQVSERLEQRDERRYMPSMLTFYAQREEAQARLVSRELEIPLAVLKVGSSLEEVVALFRRSPTEPENQ